MNPTESLSGGALRIIAGQVDNARQESEDAILALSTRFRSIVSRLDNAMSASEKGSGEGGRDLCSGMDDGKQQLLKVIDGGAGRDFEEKLRAGGLGYGDLKKKLFDAYWEHFAGARAKRAELASNLDFVNGVLKAGAARARAVADPVLHRARKACGLE